jgi:hypothetical protein
MCITSADSHRKNRTERDHVGVLWWIGRDAATGEPGPILEPIGSVPMVQ